MLQARVFVWLLRYTCAERGAISRRTTEALAVARAQGVKLGNSNGSAALQKVVSTGKVLTAKEIGKLI